MILVGSLIVVSILVRAIEGYSDVTYVMTKGGLDEATTKELLRTFRSNVPEAVVRMRNVTQFCDKHEDVKEGICQRIFGLQEVRDIVQTKYNPQSHTSWYNFTSFQCRGRRVDLMGDDISDSNFRSAANFIRCPTPVSRAPELQWSDFYVTIDHNGGYYLFGAPLGEDLVQPIAHIEKQRK